jgi:hypothetical protein
LSVNQPGPTEPGSANGAEQQQKTAQANGQQNTTKTVETAKEQAQTGKSPCAGYLGHLFRKIENEQSSAQWRGREILWQIRRKMAFSPSSWRENRREKTKRRRNPEMIIIFCQILLPHPWYLYLSRFNLLFDSHGATHPTRE